MILAIRTDRPEAELAIANAGDVLEKYKWMADRQLADTLLEEIQALMDRQRLAWADLTGIIAYQGPGSFTGLRIGITVANTIAYSQNLPIVGSTGDAWVQDGLKSLASARPGGQIMPAYGAEPNISKPKE